MAMDFVAKTRLTFPVGLLARVSGRLERRKMTGARRAARLDGGADRERRDLEGHLGAREARWRLLC